MLLLHSVRNVGLACIFCMGGVFHNAQIMVPTLSTAVVVPETTIVNVFPRVRTLSALNVKYTDDFRPEML